MMNRVAVIMLAVTCISASTGVGQVTLGGQTSTSFLKSASTSSQREVNNARPSFAWRADLFLSGYVNENVAALCNVRVTDDQSINFDYLAVRLMNLTPLGLNLQAGKIDLPFGNLGERWFPRKNPLFGLPVIYEYRNALPEYIATETKLLANRGRGQGMRLLNLGMYDLGVMLSGSFDILDYAVAVTSGTISETSYLNGNSNSDLGMVLRLAATPMTGLTVGASYAWGAYLDEPGQPPARNIDVNAYRQRAIALDVEFSRGHAVLDGEAVYNIWPVPLGTRDENFKVFGYYLEGRYTILPRVYVALRVSGLQFGDALLGQAVQPWDYDVTEVEGGVGYFVDRDVLLKLVRRETRIDGGTRPKDNLTVLQLTVAY